MLCSLSTLSQKHIVFGFRINCKYQIYDTSKITGIDKVFLIIRRDHSRIEPSISYPREQSRALWFRHSIISGLESWSGVLEWSGVKIGVDFGVDFGVKFGVEVGFFFC